MVQHFGMESVDMGVTRQQLKSIVKECIIEILAEGMGPTVSESINEVKSKVKQITSPFTHNSAMMLKQNASKAKLQSSALREAIRIESGGNDMMAAILADTAEKTLPSMLENDKIKSPRATGKIENIVAAYEPEELFGEDVTSKWADLAFIGAQKK